MIKRPLYLNKLAKFKDTDFIKVITGVRRSGKTFLLQMFRDSLLEKGIAKEQVVYINFESMIFKDIKDSKNLHTYIMDHKVNNKMYLFFDEIQRVKDWEEAINSLRVDLDSDIYISGSNAYLLSGELSTYLSGRFIEIRVYPLSFKEYLDFVDTNKSKEEIFNEYIERGGFPAVAKLDDDLRSTVIDGIYSSILLKDVSSRASIRNDYLLNRLTSYILSEVGNTISINNIVNTLKSNGVKSVNSNTISSYIEALKKAYIIYEAKRYDLRGKSILSSGSKYYAVDTGLRNTSLNKTYRDNYGHQIENIVYIELLRRAYQVNVGKINNKEIDFVAYRGKEVEYFQVTKELGENKERELGNFRLIKDNYKKTLITANRMDTGSYQGHQIVHIIDWLLDED